MASYVSLAICYFFIKSAMPTKKRTEIQLNRNDRFEFKIICNLSAIMNKICTFNALIIALFLLE